MFVKMKMCENSCSYHLASLVTRDTIQLSIVETVNKDEVSLLKLLKKKKEADDAESPLGIFGV